jgi:hypothetical protein
MRTDLKEDSNKERKLVQDLDKKVNTWIRNLAKKLRFHKRNRTVKNEKLNISNKNTM